MTRSTDRGQWRRFVVLILGLSGTMSAAASLLPEILQPTDDTISTREGDSCRINCTAHSMWPKFCLVYWLVNDTFIEDMFPDGRVKEEDRLQSVNNGGKSRDVGKDLVFTSTQAQDFAMTFTCVVQDPAGAATKNITLLHSPGRHNRRARSDGRKGGGKKRKNSRGAQNAGRRNARKKSPSLPASSRI